MTVLPSQTGGRHRSLRSSTRAHLAQLRKARAARRLAGLAHAPQASRMTGHGDGSGSQSTGSGALCPAGAMSQRDIITIGSPPAPSAERQDAPSSPASAGQEANNPDRISDAPPETADSNADRRGSDVEGTAAAMPDAADTPGPAPARAGTATRQSALHGAPPGTGSDSVTAADPAPGLPALPAAPEAAPSGLRGPVAAAGRPGSSAAGKPPETAQIVSETAEETAARWGAGDPAGDAMYASNLSSLPGAGPGLVWLLGECGIRSMGELAAADAERLAGRMGVIGELLDLDHWIDLARRRA